MDKKLPDNDIKKALADCIKHNGSCFECPSYEFCDKNDSETVMEMVLDYINRLEAENERLNKLADLGNMRANDYRAMRDKYLNAKAEAYKEFAERLKKGKQYSVERHENIVPVAVIDWILKEMVGEDNG